MPSSLLAGSPAQHERHIGCQAKLNGNTPHAAARKPSTGGATSFNLAWSIATIALTSETLSSQLRSAASGQIRSDCMIWVAASISGWRTAGTRITRALRLTVRHGQRANAVHTLSGPVLGKMTRGMFDHLIAMVTIPTKDIRR